jgi:hypothetical protein
VKVVFKTPHSRAKVEKGAIVGWEDYQPGDEAELPVGVAKELIKAGVAEEVKKSKPQKKEKK